MTSTLHPTTREFLSFLGSRPDVRDRIAARPDKTLVYAGDWSKPAWVELGEMRRAAGLDFDLLPDVLAKIPAPPGSTGSLLDHVEAIIKRDKLPWKPDGLVIWRALSGIYAKNARGLVFAFVGRNLSIEKVFVATEIKVLLRNYHIDPVSTDFFRALDGRLKTLKAASPSFDLEFGYVPLPPARTAG